MRNFYLFIAIAMFFTLSVNAQVFESDFSAWTNGNPDSWVGLKTSLESDSIIEVTTGAVHGTSAARLVNTESSHKRLTTIAQTVVANQSYEITFSVRGDGNIRTALFDTSYGAYNSYITVNATDWTEYSQVVTAVANSDSAEFILSFRYTGTDFQIDYVSISEVTVTIPDVSVYDIQYTTDASGDSPYMDQTVNTGGIVTAVLSNGYFIQSGQGPWSGVFVYDGGNAANVAIGDSLTFQCLVAEYYNLTELKNVASFTNVSSGNAIHERIISTADVNQEMYEGCYIYTLNASCTNTDLGNGEWEINDNSGAAVVDDKIYAFTPTANEAYNVKGVVDFGYGEYKILPRFASDVAIYSSVNELNAVNISTYPNPANDFINFDNVKGVDNIQIVDIRGQVVENITVNSDKVSVKTSCFKSGLYIANLRKGNEVISVRFIKK